MNKSNFSILPSIELAELSELFEIENNGESNLGSYVARLNQKEVFIKKLERFGAQEALWLMYLNRIGLGVQFHGVTYIDGSYALVLDKAPGFNSKIHQSLKDLPPDFKLNEAMISEMRRQTIAAFNSGLVNGDPLKWAGLSLDRVWLQCFSSL